MSPLKTSLLTALAAATFTTGCLYFVRNARAREAAGLRYANDRMRFEANQRRHAASPAVPSKVGTSVESPPHPSSVTTSPAALPAENYRNAGRATPLACLQTCAWACDRGDTATVVGMLYIDPAARVKAEAYRAALPDTARKQWPSVDEMAAALLTADAMQHPFPGADILDTATIEPLAADRVLLRLPGTPKDRIEYQKIGDAWSYVITEAAVDAYLAQVAARPAAP